MAARTSTAIADVEKLPDFSKTKTDPLGAVDEAQSLRGVLSVNAVPG